MHKKSTRSAVRSAVRAGIAGWAVSAVLLPGSAWTQEAAPHPGISDSQRGAAEVAVQQGLAAAELNANAPAIYVVQRGDTLWGIAALYLKRPWRWPELWGMNQQAIANPHKIFPGQTLYLLQEGGLLRLSTHAPGKAAGPGSAPLEDPPTVRLSPRTRSESLSELAIPALKPHLIEPFLVQPIVVEDDVLQRAPRIMATIEDRVLMSNGDRVYARGDASQPLLRDPSDPTRFQIYRNAVALKDPLTQAVLGYEAQYVGKAELVQGEMLEEFDNGKGGMSSEYVPAIVTLSSVKEEVRAGDRLLPAPERVFNTYIPRAPSLPIDARVVSLYGSAQVRFVGQNQVVAINKGTEDGMEPGHVLQVLTRGERVRDETDPDKPLIKLPSERNGLAMVFRTFERISYVLLVQVDNTVRVGDRMTNPQ